MKLSFPIALLFIVIILIISIASSLMFFHYQLYVEIKATQQDREELQNDPELQQAIENLKSKVESPSEKPLPVTEPPIEPEQEITENVVENGGFRVAVPAYFYPGYRWNDIEQADMIIMNVKNGPSSSPDSNYERVVKEIGKEKFLGYVYTSYGSRSLDDVKREIDRWNEFYGVSDIFLDEVDNEWSNYYKDIYDYVKQREGDLIINPGTVPHEKFMDYSDGIMIFETDFESYKWRKFPPWVHKYPAERFWHTIHSTPADKLDEAKELLKKNNVGVIYVTDDTMPYPYDGLPSYWDELTN